MEDREKLIREKLKEEELIDVIQLRGINQMVWEMLIKEKGFNPEEIEINPEFRLQLSNCEANVSVDFIINISSVSFMVIRSVSTAIESWERYIVAFARAVKDYQIPYAVITDGENFKIYNVLSGSLLSESIQGLFNRQEALNLMKDFQKIPCPAKRQEKEKRIVYAFEGIKCPTKKE